MGSPRKTIFSEWVKTWLALVKPNLKKSSFSIYVVRIKKHIMPFFGELALKDLTADSLSVFIEELDEKNLAPKTITDIFELLQSIFIANCPEQKKLFTEARHNLPTEGEKVYDVLDDEEKGKLHSYLILNVSPKNLGIMIGLYCGLRIGEVCALKWSDIDLEKRLITVKSTVYRVYEISFDEDKGKSEVNTSSPKTRRSNRLVPIPRDLNNLLIAAKDKFNVTSDKYILTSSEKMAEPRTFSSYYERLLKKCGLEHHTFHCLRHTFATKAALEGMNPEDLSRILGHANVNITLSRYYHPKPEDLVSAIDRIYR